MSRDPCVKCEDFCVPLQPHSYECWIHANIESKRARWVRYAFEGNFIGQRHAKAMASLTKIAPQKSV